MKVYIYQLFYIHEESQTHIELGYFTSLPEVRRCIEEDGSVKEDYVVWRHKLNPKTEADMQSTEVEVYGALIGRLA